MCDKPRFVTKDIPRTRDENGKYIRKSCSNFTETNTFIRDGKFHQEECKINLECEMDTRKKNRNPKGYESLQFTLSTPVNDCNTIFLPSEWNFKSIHVDDIFIQINNITFRDSFWCTNQNVECTNHPSLNEIWFTEGVIATCNEIKLNISGKCIIKPKTWNDIQIFEFCDPLPSGTEFKKIKLRVPCHNISGECPVVYLLENCKFLPLEIQFWPFQIDNIIDKNTILVSPKGNDCKIPIPNTFSPTILLCLPPLGECNIAEYVMDATKEIFVNWNCECREYEIDTKCNKRNFKVAKILPRESEYFLARISPKKYKDASELYPEIQRAMNPPLVTDKNRNIKINDVSVSITIREYLDANDLAQELEDQINSSLGWVEIVQEITVSYNDQCGKFSLCRIGPFKMEFPDNSLIDLLGFSDYVFIGNKLYTSNYSIFYISVNTVCNSIVPSNRYIASYDSINDLISINAISQSNYMSFMIPGYIPDDNYHYYLGHNFVLPFGFLCESPFTSYLNFTEKNCFTQWISSVGVSNLLCPPPILYFVIPELENDIIISKEKCFTSAMAILYLDNNCKTYKAKCSGCLNNLTWKKNVSKENLCKLTVKYFTETGIEYCLYGSRGIINLCLSV